MEQERIKSISEKLELKREIVGIRFLVYEQDYDACSAEQAGIKTRLCGFVNRATHGKRIDRDAGRIRADAFRTAYESLRIIF